MQPCNDRVAQFRPLVNRDFRLYVGNLARRARNPAAAERNPAPPPARRAGDGRGRGETHDAQRTTPRTATPSDGGPRAPSGGEAAAPGPPPPPGGGGPPPPGGGPPPAPGPPEPERRADNRRGGAKPGAAQHDRGRPAHRESRDRDRPARAAPADARRAARHGRRAAAPGEGQRQGKRRRTRPDHQRRAGASGGTAGPRRRPQRAERKYRGDHHGAAAFASPAGDQREGRSAARRRGTARRPAGRRSTLECLPPKAAKRRTAWADGGGPGPPSGRLPSASDAVGRS